MRGAMDFCTVMGKIAALLGQKNPESEQGSPTSSRLILVFGSKHVLQSTPVISWQAAIYQTLTLK